MKATGTILLSAGIGASLMYLTDPQGGRRRRAVLGDRAMGGLRKAGAAAGVGVRDLGNRARGIVAEAYARLVRREVDDRVLAERVRAELGRVCSHPRAIDVEARQGRVTLAGPILADEAERVRAWVASTPGVEGVVSHLEIHEDAGGTPALQGGVPRGVRSGFLQTAWPPAVRLAGGAAGAAMALYGAGRGGVSGVVVGVGGLGLLARSLTNLELRRLVGLGSGRPLVSVRKSVNVRVPRARAYQFWTDVEGFPRFMANVLEVKKLGDGRSRWSMAGPGGVRIEWEAVITRQVPNLELAWTTVPGSPVEHSGHVRFLPSLGGGTRIDVHFSYAPPAGALGHGVAWLLGADPRTEIDADLARMKAVLEERRDEIEEVPLW